jgi:hypothetical protein
VDRCAHICARGIGFSQFGVNGNLKGDCWRRFFCFEKIIIIMATWDGEVLELLRLIVAILMHLNICKLQTARSTWAVNNSQLNFCNTRDDWMETTILPGNTREIATICVHAFHLNPLLDSWCVV